jgi:hypothetical protein
MATGAGRIVSVMFVEWLAESMAGGGAEDGPGRGRHRAGEVSATDEVQHARERICSAVSELIDSGGGAPGVAATGPPVVLTDSVVRRLVACEGLAVAAASAAPVEVTWPMFRGRALDAFVQHVLFAGPVADAVPDLRSMWVASESTEDLEMLERFTSGKAGSGEAGSGGTALNESAVEDLAGLAAHAMVFSGSQPYAPRTEVRMGVTFAGLLELRGRVDVLFGGPGTDLPAVLVEVKSGRIRDEHRAQLRHYILLAALRHGEAPAGAMLWSPESGLEPLHVPGVLASSAERVAAAVVSLAEISVGREPTLTPGVHCRFCPVTLECPLAWGGSGDDEDATWVGSDSWFDDLGSEGAWL